MMEVMVEIEAEAKVIGQSWWLSLDAGDNSVGIVNGLWPTLFRR
jgi:hypothetical protein